MMSAFATHEVLNQSPSFEDINLFSTDRALTEAVSREGGGAAAKRLEAFGAASSGRAAPRIFGLAVPLTLLSGLYMGARFGVLADAWMYASYGAIVVMAATGPLARRSDALRQLSLRARATFGLAVVFLMVAKPDAMLSVVVLGLALGISMLVGVPIGLKQQTDLSSTEA